MQKADKKQKYPGFPSITCHEGSPGLTKSQINAKGFKFDVQTLFLIIFTLTSTIHK
jgi:hypothetical protein